MKRLLLLLTLTAIPCSAAETPVPDPCSVCPEPGSFACENWPEACYQCWINCGNPQASPTPTPTLTPTATPTPTHFPCVEAGPACRLVVYGGCQMVFLRAYYAHEDKPGHRYIYTALPQRVCPNYVARPCVEGYPVGFEWRRQADNGLIKSCGDTSTVFPPTPTPTPTPELALFEDGFETGDTSRWSRSVP